jgi:hypothetical protein
MPQVIVHLVGTGHEERVRAVEMPIKNDILCTGALTNDRCQCIHTVCICTPQSKCGVLCSVPLNRYGNCNGAPDFRGVVKGLAAVIDHVIQTPGLRFIKLTQGASNDIQVAPTQQLCRYKVFEQFFELRTGPVETLTSSDQPHQGLDLVFEYVVCAHACFLSGKRFTSPEN